MKLTTFIFTIFVGSFTVALSAKTGNPTASLSRGLFKENKGQIYDQFFKPRPDVLFIGRSGGLNFHLRKTGLSYQLERVSVWKKSPTRKAQHPIKSGTNDSVPDVLEFYRVDIDWPGANPSPEILTGQASDDYENYYSENAALGVMGIRNYKTVTYKNIYQGIDLEWTEQNGQLKYNYHLQAGADHSQIQLQYKGCSQLYVNRQGELVVETAFGNIVEQQPLVIQNSKILKSHWVVVNNTARFEIDGLDTKLPCTIDPIIRLFGSYYGGQSGDAGMLVTDNIGNFYIFGETSSLNNIASSGAYQTTYGGGSTWGDAFVAKFDILGSRQWATYYGGAQSDFANWCTVDNSGNIYLVGGSSSTNAAVMATAGSHQSVSPGPSNTSQGTNDAYLVKFNSAGARIWGTYYGGSNVDWAYYVAVEPNSGDIAITGCSYSSNGISTSGCHQAAISGTNSGDGFIARFTANGTRLWGTYYGGSSPGQEDFAWCGFTTTGDLYVVGTSSSNNNLSTPGSYQPIHGGSYDAVLAKFSGSGVLIWGSYYGSPGNDNFAIGAMDASNNLYVYGLTGSTLASVFVTSGAIQSTYAGGPNDTYLVKFDPNCNRLWGTYYGGAGNESIGFPAVSNSADIYICGGTSALSTTGTAIATPCAYQNNYGGGSSDGFFAKINSTGLRQWGTLYGGGAIDAIYTAVIDFHGSLYVCGVTKNTLSAAAFTTNGAYQTVYAGGTEDSFYAKFDGCAPLSPVNNTPQHQLHICLGKTATLSTNCGNWYADSLSTLALGSGSLFTTGPLQHDTTFFIEETSCGYSIGRTAVHVTVTPPPAITVVQSNTTACIGEYTDLNASGAVTYTWQGLNPGAADTINPVNVWLIIPTTYTVTGTDQYGCKNTASISIVPNLCLGVEEAVQDLSVDLFPNPSNGSFSVRSGTEREFILSNALGETLMRFTVLRDQSYSVQIQQLASGIYFLKDEKAKSSKKIIVMR